MRREVVGPGVIPEGGLRWSARPLGGLVCTAHAQGLLLLPVPENWKLAFGLFVSCCL